MVRIRSNRRDMKVRVSEVVGVGSKPISGWSRSAWVMNGSGLSAMEQAAGRWGLAPT